MEVGGWRKDEKALLPWPRAMAFGLVAPYSWLINSSFPRVPFPRKVAFPRGASFPLNPSFPRKRESRDLCDRTDGLGRMALDSWSPIGVGDELSRE